MCRDNINGASPFISYMEHTLEKEKMDSIRVLADTNMKISEAKGILFKLQETETEYLVEREKKAVSKIEKALEDSKGLIKQVHENYEEIKGFSRDISDFAAFLSKSYDSFHEMLKDFNEKSDLWEKDISQKEREISETKDKMKVERTLIENDRSALQQKQKILKDEQRKIEDQRGTLARAIERLKENRI